MEDIITPCFVSVAVKPGETVKVEVPEGTIWEITSISVMPADDLPAEGRVVLYAATVAEDGTKGEKVALAPLRIAKCEVVNVDFTINCAEAIEFTTTGAAVGVNINGTMSSCVQLKITTTQ